MDKNNLPKHIAIILDGNRRWAKAKGRPASFGHKTGADTLEKIVRYANKIGIKHLTAYVFSTENWKRTTEEVSAIMAILQNYLDDFSKRANLENIKINKKGNPDRQTKKKKKSLQNCMERTKNNTGIVFNIALNYGGRDEIVRAVRTIAEKVQKDEIKPEEITENTISENLYTKNQPDPDLVIRTSGEERISNFLLWQIAYSEFLFVQKNWPDFTEEDLDRAIEEYQKRTRKFGAN